MPKYKWEKRYAVVTDDDDPVKEGDVIVVDDVNGGSEQQVLSVTRMPARSAGKYYRVLLLREIRRLNRQESDPASNLATGPDPL